MSAVDMEQKMENDRDANGPKDQSPQNHPGGRGGGGRGGMGGGGRGNRFNRQRDDMRNIRQQDDRLNERLSALAGPTLDLPPQDVREKKFSGRCRLYVGNLTNDVTEEEINGMFSPYGETSEVFVNKDKNFAFIRLDYRASAEKAKRELDGHIRKGRALKVRFAPHSAAVKVRNLTQWVTNELLERAFQVFGEIERAVVVVDERGKSTGEGIIEFARKPGAQMALRKCTEGCFFLTSSLRPVVLEPFEQVDEVDGYTERNLPKKNPDYMKSREVGPRFAAPGSFEYEYGTRWKQLFELRKQKEEALNRELKMEEEKLEAQMEYARYEHETEMLREQLRMREQDRERQKREWELKERQHEEQRRQDEDMMRRQQEDMDIRMRHQEEEMRRRQQENSLFMQAHQLNSLLDQQEQALRQAPGGGGGYDSPLPAEASIREYDAAIGGPVGGPGSLPPRSYRVDPAIMAKRRCIQLDTYGSDRSHLEGYEIPKRDWTPRGEPEWDLPATPERLPTLGRDLDRLPVQNWSTMMTTRSRWDERRDESLEDVTGYYTYTKAEMPTTSRNDNHPEPLCTPSLMWQMKDSMDDISLQNPNPFLTIPPLQGVSRPIRRARKEHNRRRRAVNAVRKSIAKEGDTTDIPPLQITNLPQA